jgi:hypothetical protein
METWSQEELDKRLAAVREALLQFLSERHRLEWLEHKVRWRLSRRFIWPARSREERAALLDEAVAGDVSVEAFRDYLTSQQRSISDAIERYNHAVRRNYEEEAGKPVADFGSDERGELRRRRITFQGTRDELCRVARTLRQDSPVDRFPELLSLRLAILTREVRDEIFSEAAAFVADEAADAEDLDEETRDLLAYRAERWLRCHDQYHVARLLAKNYAEARRLMSYDDLLNRLQELVAEERETPEPSLKLRERIAVLRGVLRRYTAFLEEIFPASADTHTREATVLRQP